MSPQIQLAALIVSILFFVISYSFVRKTSVRPSYTLSWVLIGCFLISIPIFHGFYKWLANDIFGIVDTTHVITLGLLGFCMFYLLHLTIRLGKVSHEVQILLSYTAILEKELRELKK